MKLLVTGLFVFSAVAGSGMLAEEAVSPFVPPAPPASKAPQTTPASPLDSLEFSGVIEIGGVVQISLYDPKTKESYWLSQDQAAEGGISLVSYDGGQKRGEDVVVVRHGGVTKRLALKDADIITLKEAPRPVSPRPSQGAPAPQINPRPQPGGGAPAQNIRAASDEEVRARMQRVAEEIRRRRATRRDLIEEGSGARSDQ